MLTELRVRDLAVIADVTLPALRYVCRPEIAAFLGSERVDG